MMVVRAVRTSLISCKPISGKNIAAGLYAKIRKRTYNIMSQLNVELTALIGGIPRTAMRDINVKITKFDTKNVTGPFELGMTKENA